MKNTNSSNHYKVNLVLIYFLSIFLIGIASAITCILTGPKDIDMLLTSGEKSWLYKNRNSIKVGLLNNNHPFEYRESERPGGLHFHYISTLENRLNVRFLIKYFPNNEERLKALNAGRINFFLNETKGSDDNDFATNPIFRIPVISIRLKNQGNINQIRRVRGISRLSPSYEHLQKTDKFSSFIKKKNEILGLSALADKEIDLFVSDLASYRYFTSFYTGPPLIIDHYHSINIPVHARVYSQDHWLFSILEKIAADAKQYPERWDMSYSKNCHFMKPDLISIHNIALNMLLLSTLFLLLILLFFQLHFRHLISPEAEAFAENTLFLKMMDEINPAIILTDKETNITYCNNAAKQLLPSEINDPLGLPFDSSFLIYDSNGRINSPLRKVLATLMPASLPPRCFIKNRKGENIWISDNFSPLVNNENEIETVFIVLNNYSEKSEQENELFDNEKMEAISRITGEMIFRTNTHLEGIRGFAELINKQSSESKVKYYSERIIESSLLLEEQNETLSAISENEEVPVAPVKIHEIINELEERLFHQQGDQITLETKLQATTDCVAGNRKQLSKLIYHLCINAIEAIFPADGRIIITSENIKLNMNYCRANPFTLTPGDYILIRIIDTGRGISSEIRPRIFEPYFTNKDKKNHPGLGLSLVYGAIINQSGSIAVYSDESEGSEFHVYLPLCPQIARLPEPEVSPLKKHGTILVVDDEPVVRELTRTLLDDLGLNVLIAKDGEEGEEVFKQNIDRVSLVLLDMIMPKRSGAETYIALKAVNPQIPVVITSGFSLNSHIRQILDSGAVSFLNKPYRKGELIDILNQYLPD